MVPPSVIKDVVDITDLFEEADTSNPFYNTLSKKTYVASTPFYHANGGQIELVFEKVVNGKDDYRYYVTIYHHNGTPYNTPMKEVQQIELSATSFENEFIDREMLGRLDLKKISDLTIYAIHVAQQLVNKYIQVKNEPKPVFAYD